MSEESDVTKSMNAMATKIGELVIEIRHSNERFDDSQKRTDKVIDLMQKDHKALREHVVDLRERMPLVEDTRKDIKSISSKIIGSILVVALMSALAAGFAMKTAKASPAPQVIERSK